MMKSYNIHSQLITDGTEVYVILTYSLLSQYLYRSTYSILH